MDFMLSQCNNRYFLLERYLKRKPLSFIFSRCLGLEHGPQTNAELTGIIYVENIKRLRIAQALNGN